MLFIRHFRRVCGTMCVVAAVLLSSFLNAQGTDFWAARVAQGAGDGSSPANAADYLNAGFWSTAQNQLYNGDVNVNFLDGAYNRGPLKLTHRGNPLHRLTLRAVNQYGPAFSYPSDHVLDLIGTQNVAVDGLLFNGSSPWWGILCQANGRYPTRNIVIANCAFEDMTNVYYGAIGLLDGTRDVIVTNCDFTNDGAVGYAHMIYCSHNIVGVKVSHCNFTDCKADYVRFRDDSEYCSVDHCTFHSTRSATSYPFITVPCYNDVNPGDEFFGTHFQVTDNSFTYDSSSGTRAAMQFADIGYDPEDYHCALTPAEAAVLSSGTTAEKRDLLWTNMGIDGLAIKMFGNSYSSRVTYHLAYSYSTGSGGATGNGWSGNCNISDVPDASGALLDPMPALRNAGFDYRGNLARCWYGSSGLLWHPGLDGSPNALRFSAASNQSIYQWISGSTPIWTLDCLFAIGSGSLGTGTKFDIDLFHDDVTGGKLSVGVDNLGRFGIYDGGTFTVLSQLGTVAFSIDSNGNGLFTDPGDQLYVYHLRIVGDYSDATPHVDIYASDANSMALSHHAFGLAAWVNAAPVGGQSTPGTIVLNNYTAPVVVDQIVFGAFDTTVGPSVFSASTQAPGPVTPVAATLKGMVVPNGTNADAWFEWGATTNYGNQTAPTAVGNGYQVTSVSAAISGLAPHQIYHYRVSASNGAAIVHGYDRFFSTGGRVKAWGDDGFGQTDVPAGLTNTVAVASGVYHGLALDNDGAVAAWGYDLSGQTDVPTNLSTVIAVGGGAAHSIALENDGTVVAWGGDFHNQTEVPPGLTNVTAISAGSYHNLALRTDGTVAAWGWNQYGQGNVPIGLANVVAVAAGYGDSYVLKPGGTVMAWGDDTFGEVTGAVGLTNVVALAAGQFHCLALKSDGTVTAWGRNNYGQTNVPPGLGHVVAIACGENYSLALESDGTVAAWGDGTGGQTNLPPGLVEIAGLAGGVKSGCAIASQLPQVESQTASGYINHDLEIVLTGNDPDGNPLSYRITTLPGAGDLYQDAGGSRGELITAPDTVVTDPGGQVIYTPVLDETGNPYATFGFVANDGEFDSALGQVTLNIGLPAVPLLGQGGWTGGTGVNGSFAVNFAGSTNATYSVWASTNLVNWDLIGAVPEVAPGQYQYLDTSATNWPQRFYRVTGP